MVGDPEQGKTETSQTKNYRNLCHPMECYLKPHDGKVKSDPSLSALGPTGTPIPRLDPKIVTHHARPKKQYVHAGAWICGANAGSKNTSNASVPCGVNRSDVPGLCHWAQGTRGDYFNIDTARNERRLLSLVRSIISIDCFNIIGVDQLSESVSGGDY